ncbi:MAG: hypothetical protein AB1478_09940 [Nitrospirota bacterium]
MKKRGKYETTEGTEVFSVFSKKNFLWRKILISWRVLEVFLLSLSDLIGQSRKKELDSPIKSGNDENRVHRGGGDRISHNILIFNIFSVFSVVKF